MWRTSALGAALGAALGDDGVMGRRVLWRRWSAGAQDDDGGKPEAVRIEQRDDGAPAEIKRKSRSVGGTGARKKESYMGGGAFVPGGATIPFVPGGGITRDKRCFWAGRENS